MALSLNERLIMLAVPSSYYYARRIADEATWGEHELHSLDAIVQGGGTAIDAGANQGVFAFALSTIVDRVEAFEPNPDCARFAQRMLGARARVHEIALSNKTGSADFIVPVSKEGTVLHLGGKLMRAGTQLSNNRRFNVQVRTLDSYKFENVRAIKVDVEGSELQVLEGGQETISRFRPPLIVELLTGAYSDPVATTETICEKFDYSPWLVTKDQEMVEAIPVLRSLGSNTTWRSPIRNRNVLFLARA